MKKLFLMIIATLALSGCAGMDLTHVDVGVGVSHGHGHYRSNVYVSPYRYTPPPVVVYSRPRVVVVQPRRHHRSWRHRYQQPRYNDRRHDGRRDRNRKHRN